MTKEIMDRLSDILAEKSIRAVAEDAAPIKEAWDLAFGEAVPDRDAVHYDEFRWHLFSYEKLPAKSGDEARKALNEKQSQRLTCSGRRATTPGSCATPSISMPMPWTPWRKPPVGICMSLMPRAAGPTSSPTKMPAAPIISSGKVPAGADCF